MGEKQSKKRIEWVDTAKGICILFVVLNHIMLKISCENPLNDFLTSFRMPLYFFLSGVFFKAYSDFRIFIIKKINKQLIPFVFFYIVYSIIFVILFSYPIKTALTDFIFNQCQIIYGPLWFLICLFEINILFYIIHTLVKKKLVQYCVTFLIGFGGLSLAYFSIKLPLSIDSALTCLPFFVFGYYINNETPIMRHSFLDKKPYIYILCFALFNLLISRHVEFYKNFFYGSSYLTAHICGFVGTIMVILTAKKIKFPSIITYYGRYSIIILCTHMILIEPIEVFFTIFISNHLLIILCSFLTICLFELIIIPFFITYLPYICAQKELINISK